MSALAAAAAAVNIWDFLRFQVGMGVIEGRSSEGNRALVSVRGFPADLLRRLHSSVRQRRHDE